MKIRNGKEKEYREFIEINSNDPYSYGIVKFMQRFAELLENKINQSDPQLIINEYAEEIVREADTEGITGFMYNCAIGALVKYWEYGNELSHWAGILN